MCCHLFLVGTSEICWILKDSIVFPEAIRLLVFTKYGREHKIQNVENVVDISQVTSKRKRLVKLNLNSGLILAEHSSCMFRMISTICES